MDELEKLYQELEAAVAKGDIKKWGELAVKIRDIENEKALE